MTIDATNLLWLHSEVRQRGARSVSEIVDGLITDARIAKTGPIRPVRLVVGTIDLDDVDVLLGAQKLVRAEFERSIARPLYARESRVTFGNRRKRRSG